MMAELNGYIKLDRNIMRWRWWNDHNTLIVFLVCLLEANIKNNGFSGINLKRGQFATSIPTLCKITGLSVSQVRTAIQHLISTGEIAVKIYSKFRVITVVNYEKYQNIAGKIADKSQSCRSQIAVRSQQRKKERKKEEEEDNIGRCAPDPPSGGMPDRNSGQLTDIPIEHRDGTYHSFTSWTEYWDWRNQ